jgi:ribonuclease P protein component
LFNKGKSFSIHPFKLQYLFPNSEPAGIQVGFVCSSRNFKKATDRNRVKRLIKEAYRLQKGQLEPVLQNKQVQIAVFFIYTGKELPGYSLVSSHMTLILQKLVKIINEKDTVHTKPAFYRTDPDLPGADFPPART